MPALTVDETDPISAEYFEPISALTNCVHKLKQTLVQFLWFCYTAFNLLLIVLDLNHWGLSYNRRITSWPVSNDDSTMVNRVYS